VIRRAMVLIALGALSAPAWAAEPRAGTRVGAGRSWDIALTQPGEPGRPFVIEGTLLGLPDSLPIHGATITLYHADARGNYGPHGDARPRLAGTLTTNVAGGFRVRTVLPGSYDGTPHVHYRVKGAGFDHRGTLSLARRNGAGSDSAFAQLPWMLKLPGESWAYADPAAEGFHTTWTLVVERTGR